MCKKLQQETRSTKEIAMISNDEMARWKKLTGVDVKEKEREEKRLRPRKEGDKQIYLKAVKGNTQSFEL
jgi:superfamily I DNA/RNA helicase